MREIKIRARADGVVYLRQDETTVTVDPEQLPELIGRMMEVQESIGASVSKNQGAAMLRAMKREIGMVEVAHG